MSKTDKSAPARYISKVALMVRDYDEAIAFYTEKLSFVVVEDIALDEMQRWVVIAPNACSGMQLILMRATDDAQQHTVGNQTGGPVFLILETNDFWRDYQTMTEKEVVFLESPREEPYGTVVIFEDLYGNKWDLIEPAGA